MGSHCERKETPWLPLKKQSTRRGSSLQWGHGTTQSTRQVVHVTNVHDPNWTSWQLSLNLRSLSNLRTMKFVCVHNIIPFSFLSRVDFFWHVRKCCSMLLGPNGCGRTLVYKRILYTPTHHEIPSEKCMWLISQIISLELPRLVQPFSQEKSLHHVTQFFYPKYYVMILFKHKAWGYLWCFPINGIQPYFVWFLFTP